MSGLVNLAVRFKKYDEYLHVDVWLIRKWLKPKLGQDVGCATVVNSIHARYKCFWFFCAFVLKHHVSFFSSFVFLYHPLSLLICYPSSFYFYALMVVTLWEYKSPPFNDKPCSSHKDQKLTTDFEKILTFSLARGFDLVLSLGVTTPLITLVLGISWPCIFWERMFWYIE